MRESISATPNRPSANKDSKNCPRPSRWQEPKGDVMKDEHQGNDDAREATRTVRLKLLRQVETIPCEQRQHDRKKAVFPKSGGSE